MTYFYSDQWQHLFLFYPPTSKIEKQDLAVKHGFLLTPIFFNHEKMRKKKSRRLSYELFYPSFYSNSGIFLLRLFCDITTSIVSVLLQLLKKGTLLGNHTHYHKHFRMFFFLIFKWQRIESFALFYIKGSPLFKTCVLKKKYFRATK